MIHNKKIATQNTANLQSGLKVLTKINKLQSDINKQPSKSTEMRKEVMPLDSINEEIACCEVEVVRNNPDLPITPPTCAGTSFECNVDGSGNQEIININTMPCGYDYLATPKKDGNYFKFENDILHNWSNSSNETQYTKDSLRNTYGFENFQ